MRLSRVGGELLAVTLSASREIQVVKDRLSLSGVQHLVSCYVCRGHVVVHSFYLSHSLVSSPYFAFFSFSIFSYSSRSIRMISCGVLPTYSLCCGAVIAPLVSLRCSFMSSLLSRVVASITSPHTMIRCDCSDVSSERPFCARFFSDDVKCNGIMGNPHARIFWVIRRNAGEQEDYEK